MADHDTVKPPPTEVPDFVGERIYCVCLVEITDTDLRKGFHHSCNRDIQITLHKRIP